MLLLLAFYITLQAVLRCGPFGAVATQQIASGPADVQVVLGNTAFLRFKSPAALTTLSLS